MNRLVGGRIFFAVRDAGAGRHSLPIAGPYHRAVTHTVFVFQRALQDVGDDFHVAVGMGGEAVTGLHSVLVDDAQAAKPHMRRVVVTIERERVISVEPTKIKVAALFRFASSDHRAFFLPWGSHLTSKTCSQEGGMPPLPV